MIITCNLNTILYGNTLALISEPKLMNLTWDGVKLPSLLKVVAYSSLAREARAHVCLL